MTKVIGLLLCLIIILHHANLEKYHQPSFLIIRLPCLQHAITPFPYFKYILYANHYRTVPDQIC